VKTFLGFLTLIALSTASAPAAVDLSGTWFGVIKPPRGSPMNLFLTLSQRGDEIQGAVAFEENGPREVAGKIELHGDRLSFTAHLRIGTGVVIPVFRLALDGESLNGTATSNDWLAGVSLLRSSAANSDARPDEAPIVIQKVEPEYTQQAQDAKLQGTVTLVVVVDSDGKANNITLRRALGLGLDEKAIEAVRQWRFKPALKDGKLIAAYATIMVEFRLK